MNTKSNQLGKQSEKIYDRATKVLTGGVSRNTIFRNPHPFYVFMHHSHPTVNERVKALRLLDLAK